MASVEGGGALRLDAADTQTLEQRLVMVARDTVMAKQNTTIDGYVPIMQRALAHMWQRQHSQQEYQQQQPPAADDSSSDTPYQNLMVTVNSFTWFISWCEQQAAAKQPGRYPAAANSDGTQQRLPVGAVPEVQALRQRLLGSRSECNPYQGTLSLGNWKKHMFACNWLQQKQGELVYGSFSKRKHQLIAGRWQPQL